MVVIRVVRQLRFQGCREGRLEWFGMKRAGATCCHHTAAAAWAALGDAWKRAQSGTGDLQESFDEM